MSKLIPVRVILDTDDIPVSARNGACKVQCVGGRQCVCSADIKHQYHCCKNEACECRSALREGVAA